MVLKVISATYGHPEDATKSLDVTAQLAGAIIDTNAGGKLRVDVNAKTFGNIDPAEGVVKVLKVTYSVAEGGAVEEVVTEEGAALELAGKAPPQGTLMILEAKYGVLDDAEKCIDVTALVRDAAAAENNEKVAVKVDNNTMKRDPAPQKPKQLKIFYQDGPSGPVREVLRNEGETASFAMGETTAPVHADKSSEVAAHEAATGTTVSGSPSGAAAIAWKSTDGQLLANGQTFRLKGVNWTGLETEARMLNGLDSTTGAAYLDLLASYGFNGIKIPVSTTMALDMDGAPRKAPDDADLAGLSAGDVLAKVVEMARQRGIHTVLEMGRIDETQPTPDLWYDGRHSVEDVQTAWVCLLNKVPRVMGVNIKGSPHGCACWGDSNPSQDWNKAAEQIANFIIANVPGYHGLFLVEGVQNVANVDADNKTIFPAWYGGNLQGVTKHPIRLQGDGSERVVYATRAFGPSAFNQEYFNRGDFPQCMWQVWSDHFGFLKTTQGSAVVVSEFGDSNESAKGRIWSNCIVDYLTQTGLTNAFYSSGSVMGGDFKSPDTQRLENLQRLQENPTKL
ncbi:cellulase (glycosyl hydrolase family 5) subfamily protein [Nannochloropsis oceanica]